MRKLLLVLLGLFGCLLFSAGRGEGVCRAAQAATTISIDHAVSDSWLCERTYNSDLNLPRVVGEVSSSTEAPTSLRSNNSVPTQVAFRLAAAGREAAVPIARNKFTFPSHIAGSRVVDYYVYCLRRLII
ncbi:MAG: hypothetical protein RR270_02935 [Alistipes sp.]